MNVLNRKLLTAGLMALTLAAAPAFANTAVAEKAASVVAESGVASGLKALDSLNMTAAKSAELRTAMAGAVAGSNQALRSAILSAKSFSEIANLNLEASKVDAFFKDIAAKKADYKFGGVSGTEIFAAYNNAISNASSKVYGPNTPGMTASLKRLTDIQTTAKDRELVNAIVGKLLVNKKNGLMTASQVETTAEHVLTILERTGSTLLDPAGICQFDKETLQRLLNIVANAAKFSREQRDIVFATCLGFHEEFQSDAADQLNNRIHGLSSDSCKTLDSRLNTADCTAVAGISAGNAAPRNN